MLPPAFNSPVLIYTPGWRELALWELSISWPRTQDMYCTFPSFREHSFFMREAGLVGFGTHHLKKCMMPLQSTNFFRWPSLIAVIFSDDPPKHFNKPNKLNKQIKEVSIPCKCKMHVNIRVSKTIKHTKSMIYLPSVKRRNYNDVFDVIWRVHASLLCFLACMVVKIKVAGLDYVNWYLSNTLFNGSQHVTLLKDFSFLCWGDAINYCNTVIRPIRK